MSKWNEGREVPPYEPGLVTHTPSGTIIQHGGSGNSYTHWKCRCRACTDANTERTHRRRKEREAGIVPNTVTHGKSATYANWGCRCGECTVAWSAACKRQYWNRKSRGN